MSTEKPVDKAPTDDKNPTGEAKEPKPAPANPPPSGPTEPELPSG